MILTAAQREIRDLARSFARERVAPRAGAIPKRGHPAATVLIVASASSTIAPTSSPA